MESSLCNKEFNIFGDCVYDYIHNKIIITRLFFRYKIQYSEKTICSYENEKMKMLLKLITNDLLYKIFINIKCCIRLIM